jgi:1-acyl-sn-glycerol-3-phosphate acyltransferase
MKLKDKLEELLVSKEVTDQVNKMEKATGSFGYDPWGFNMRTASISMKPVKWLYDHYFRVEAFGLENIPSAGRALVIGNHSGQLPMDGVMVGTAIAMAKESPRFARSMIERFFPTVPFLGNFMNRVGSVVGDQVNCVKMLESEEVVVVFPEGVRGSGKPWKKRYQLQRFGTGFMHIAIQTASPIIPVGIVGCEETMPSLGSFDALARFLNVPYIPITVPFPLPAKIYMHFGEPMYFQDHSNYEDEQLSVEMVEQVKTEIRRLIDLGLKKRKRIFE